jgi:hypothetical protein
MFYQDALESLNFYQDAVSPDHRFWFEDSTHWLESFNDWTEPSHATPVEWPPHTPPIEG